MSWTPGEAQSPGVYRIVVRVTDNGTPSLSATTGFNVTVNEVNRAPVLASLANRNATEGTPFTFVATATDADLPANILTYSLVGAPAGATIDAATGAFSWTPGPADVGARTFSARVADDGTPSLSSQKSLTVTVKSRPDLTLTALSTTTTTVGLGATLSASSSVKNLGGSSAGAFATYFSLSPDGAYGGGDVAFSSVRSISSLASGSTSTGSTTLTVPATTTLGTYYLCAMADGANAMAEANKLDNTKCTARTLVIAVPDLRVSAVSSSATRVTRGSKLSVSNTVANDGPVASNKFAVSFALSPDPAWGGGDAPIGTLRSVSALAAATTSAATTSLGIPSSTPIGLYYVCAFADSGAGVAESNEGNNTSCSGSTVEVR